MCLVVFELLVLIQLLRNFHLLLHSKNSRYKCSFICLRYFREMCDYLFIKFLKSCLTFSFLLITSQ